MFYVHENLLYKIVHGLSTFQRLKYTFIKPVLVIIQNDSLTIYIYTRSKKI